MKIAIDAMGGDNAPKAIVEGAIKAVESIANLDIVLIGDENQIKPYLNSSSHNISIIHTTERIEGTDEPVKAVRRKKQASMVLALQEVKEKRADAAISAGNTGSLMAGGLFSVGRIPGIDRPALAPTLPTMDGKGFLFLDVGSNMDAKPEHLLQYAIMGNIYSEKVLNVNKPRIGLLNIGEEEGKGNELSKAAFSLLQNAGFNFIGNVESRDLLEGEADVVVCDGFSGNLVLKTIEGTAFSLFSVLKKELTSSFMAKLGAGLLKKKFSNIKSMLDYSEYGGASLFGLSAPIIKAHGSSNARAVFNAIKQATLIVDKNVVSMIETYLKNSSTTINKS